MRVNQCICLLILGIQTCAVDRQVNNKAAATSQSTSLSTSLSIRQSVSQAIIVNEIASGATKMSFNQRHTDFAIRDIAVWCCGFTICICCVTSTHIHTHWDKVENNRCSTTRLLENWEETSLCVSKDRTCNCLSCRQANEFNLHVIGNSQFAIANVAFACTTDYD